MPVHLPLPPTTATPPTCRRVRNRWPGPSGLLLLALLHFHAPAQAQMGPGGGGPPGGGRGAAPGAGSAAPRAAEQRPVSVEALLAPDPWRAWALRLLELQPVLALGPAQQPVFDDFLRELQQASQFKGQRLLRAVRQRPLAVSAVTDVARDLRQEAEDAQDWLDTLADLQARWSALAAALSPSQQAQVDAAYRDSRQPGRGDAAPGPAGARPGAPPPG